VLLFLLSLDTVTELLPTPTMSVGVGRIFESVCLSVCPQHNSKTNDPKVFKLGVGNDLEIPYKWYCFGFKGQRSKVKVTESVNSFSILEPCKLEPRFIDIR